MEHKKTEVTNASEDCIEMTVDFDNGLAVYISMDRDGSLSVNEFNW